MSKRFVAFVKGVVCVAMVGVSLGALALPSPKDIEAAVDAGHLAQAESMLREVIQEKPQSAKAHYELGEVLAREGHYAQAAQELKEAKSLEPSLKFTHQPEQFNALFEKVSGLAANANLGAKTPTAAVVQTPAVPVQTAQSGVSLTAVWVGIALLVVVALLIRRRQPAVTVVDASLAPRGFGAQYTPNAPAAYPPGYAPNYPPGYAPPSSGSTMTGAVVGGLTGLAAGYALSRAMEGEQRVGQAYPSAAGSVDGSGYVPIDNPAPADFGSFDAGAGDGWDNAGNDVASGGDDSW